MERTAVALARPCSCVLLCFALAALGCDDEERAPVIPAGSEDGPDSGTSARDAGETDGHAAHGGGAGATHGAGSEHGSADAAIVEEGAAGSGSEHGSESASAGHSAAAGGQGGAPGSGAFGDGSAEDDAGVSGSGGHGAAAGHGSSAGSGAEAGSGAQAGSGGAGGSAGQAQAGSGGAAGSGHAAAGGGGQVGAAGSGCPATGCAPICASCGECEQSIPPGSDTSHHSEPIDYKDPPPTWGPHNPCWTRWGVHETQVADERWVHNLEHGGVVFLYNCPDGCPAELAMLTELANASRRTVLTSYDLLPGRFAVVSWGHRLVTSCFDLAALGQFYSNHFDHGPESLDDQPDPSCPP